MIKQYEDDYELLSVSGYMLYDTEIEVNEADITNVENVNTIFNIFNLSSKIYS